MNNLKLATTTCIYLALLVIFSFTSAKTIKPNKLRTSSKNNYILPIIGLTITLVVAGVASYLLFFRNKLGKLGNPDNMDEFIALNRDVGLQTAKKINKLDKLNNESLFQIVLEATSKITNKAQRVHLDSFKERLAEAISPDSQAYVLLQNEKLKLVGGVLLNSERELTTTDRTDTSKYQSLRLSEAAAKSYIKRVNILI